MNASSVITLSETAVKNNISFLKNKLGKDVKISAVVKANAYGHGIEKIVPVFQKYGIDHYAVFYYSEAIRVYNSLTKPAAIMIMGWVADNYLKDVLEKGIEFYVFNIERLIAALKYAKKLNIPAKIHLEAETGMNRSGLNTEELKQAISIILENKAHFEVAGFCTHLAGSESISNHTRIIKQLKKYQTMASILDKSGLSPIYKHVANSAAAFVYPKSRMQMARIGIMMYGFWPSTEVFIQYINRRVAKSDKLERVLGWKSQVMSVKDIKSGEFVGYGISYLAQINIKTALIPVGYASGYSRSLSNRGMVLIRGIRCGVIGIVNMNMVVIDVTNVPDVQVGDEVVIIGKQGQLEIKVSAFSDVSEQLNYEVLSHLSESIKRTVIKQ